MAFNVVTYDCDRPAMVWYQLCKTLFGLSPTSLALKGVLSCWEVNRDSGKSAKQKPVDFDKKILKYIRSGDRTVADLGRQQRRQPEISTSRLSTWPSVIRDQNEKEFRIS